MNQESKLTGLCAKTTTCSPNAFLSSFSARNLDTCCLARRHMSWPSCCCFCCGGSSRPHGLQNARLPCSSPSPRICPVHIHCIGDAIQPSHPVSLSFPAAFNLSLHQGALFQWFSSSNQGAKVLELQLQHQSFQRGLISFKIDWFDLLAFQGTLLLNVASWMWVTGVGAYSLSHPLFFSCFRQGHSHKSQLWSWDVLGMAKQYALDNFVDSLLLFSYEKKKKIHPVWITVF